MKRILSVLVAFVVLSTITVQAQVKIDVVGFKKKLEKSDDAIANPKKADKASTWENRGELLFEIATEPTNGLYIGMERISLDLMFGKKEPVDGNVGEVKYSILHYPYFSAYVEGTTLKFWDTKKSIIPKPLEASLDAYYKAYELDNEANIKTELTRIADVYKETAGNLFALQKYAASASAFRNAYKVRMHPSINEIDTSSLFNAGFLSTHAELFKEGIVDLNKALEYGYENEGNTHYYLYFCYYGTEDTEAARKILLEGLAKYPKNNEIVEGLLNIYTSGAGDPKEIIPIVERAIENDPKNADLWSGLGRICDKLEDFDGAINAFKEAAALEPEVSGAQFNLGLLYIKKSDSISDILQKKVFSSQAEFDNEHKIVFDMYRNSVEPLERAHNLDPKNVAIIELLKNVSFRLRDEEGMMDKYTKYNTLFKSM